MALAYKAFRTENKKTQAEHFKTKSELATHLQNILKPGDTLLVKGSRGMKMEELIDMLQTA
jgi:UDP-N-acetylmuramoyl-tripeptide--D-alanyl-D-alanine ligase